jgi:pyruvate/2-oxoglutarate dehydrogenase complex dihydrolipoamide acyltransferase (E2) component
VSTEQNDVEVAADAEVQEAPAEETLPETEAPAEEKKSRPKPMDYRSALAKKREELAALETEALQATQANGDRTAPDPDRFLTMAKELVVTNYNDSRPLRTSAELTVQGVYIVWFSKTLGNWKAIVASPVIRGLLWEVSYNGNRREAYIDVYKKLNNTRIKVEA